MSLKVEWVCRNFKIVVVVPVCHQNTSGETGQRHKAVVHVASHISGGVWYGKGVPRRALVSLISVHDSRSTLVYGINVVAVRVHHQAK